MNRGEYKLDMVSVRLVDDAPLLSDEPCDTPEAAARIIGGLIRGFDREAMAVVNLDLALRPVSAHIASIGTVGSTLAAPRELLKTAFLSNAAAIMMVHNHPSGRAEPSRQDDDITIRMHKICDLAGIQLIDHVIVTPRGGLYSYADGGRLPTVYAGMGTAAGEALAPYTVHVEDHDCDDGDDFHRSVPFATFGRAQKYAFATYRGLRKFSDNLSVSVHDADNACLIDLTSMAMIYRGTRREPEEDMAGHGRGMDGHDDDHGMEP